MNRLLKIVVAIISVATIVSCGASSARTLGGFKNTKATDAAIKSNPSGQPAESFYVYATTEATCATDLAAMNINLSGILSPAYASRPIKSFSLALSVSSTLKLAYITMIFAFEGDDTDYLLQLTTSGTPVINNTMMQMQFVDNTQIALTANSGVPSSTISVTIQDSGYPVIFANNTPLTLIQVPTTTATK
ncbi:MAG: hypothetical protein WCQ47_08600 [bacterium]